MREDGTSEKAAPRKVALLSYRQAKKIVIGVIGGTVLLLGAALIILPGPAFLVIPAGLAILATEFTWARSLLNKARDYIDRSSKRTDPADPNGKRSWGLWGKKKTPANRGLAGDLEKETVGDGEPLTESR